MHISGNIFSASVSLSNVHLTAVFAFEQKEVSLIPEKTAL